MAEPADGLREAAERLATAARDAYGELSGRWRGDARRLGEQTGATLEGVFRELGLVSRRDFDELELRVAQLEHRVRLLEGPPRAAPGPAE
jgi:polyhydroxyalkanoate synthesis regulator phasin